MKHFLLALTAIISLGSCTQQKYAYKHPVNHKTKHPAVWKVDRFNTPYLYARDRYKNRIFSGVSAYNNPLFYNNRSSNHCSTNW